jgi:hypothetical protein
MDVRACEEPAIVYEEKHFEMAVRSVIQATAPADTLSWIVPRLGLDLSAVVLNSVASRSLYIEIEAKSYGGQRRGGVGFGNGKGEGPQVDLLLSSPDQLANLDRHVRWAFVDATRPRGTPRYALLTCSEARNAAMGGVARGKQNNFKISAIKAYWTAWPTFCEHLLAFLSGS